MKKLIDGRFLALLLIAVPLMAMAHGISEADRQSMLDGGYVRYIGLGASHMLTGYDHLLFLFGVVFFLSTFKDIAKFVTVFTVGHCMTLIFATYYQITWNYYLVDAIIAISVIYKRLQVGHWECDTVIGANHKQAIVTMVERKSGYAVMAKVSNKTSDLVGSAIIEALNPLKARVKTLTYDNGKEFSGHAEIDKALGSTGYFARPFASWERGSNENFNGLLRQYVPKKRQMANITDQEIKMIENRLNNRPRKRLGFRTPAEVFHQSLSRVALRA